MYVLHLHLIRADEIQAHHCIISCGVYPLPVGRRFKVTHAPHADLLLKIATTVMILTIVIAIIKILPVKEKKIFSINSSLHVTSVFLYGAT